MPVEKTIEELFDEYVILENSLKDTFKMQEMIASGYYEKRKQQIISKVKQQVRREMFWDCPECPIGSHKACERCGEFN